MKHSVTSACRVASKAVSRPVGQGTSWTVYYTETGQNATRSVNADTYSKALKMMVETKALIAIELLGESWGYQWNNGPDIEVYLKITEGGNWRKAVSFAHKQAITQ